MRFRFQLSVPPDGYFYTTPKGRFVETFASFDALMGLAREALEAEGSPVPADLRAVLEDHMCRSLPKGFCDGDPKIVRPTYLSILNATDYIAKTASDAGGYGRQKMQDIERRGELCSTCPMHHLQMCVTCNGLMSAFDKYKIGRRTPYDRSLRVCRATLGLLPILIHADAKYIKPLQELPDHCWIKKETSDVRLG